MFSAAPSSPTTRAEQAGRTGAVRDNVGRIERAVQAAAATKAAEERDGSEAAPVGRLGGGGRQEHFFLPNVCVKRQRKGPLSFSIQKSSASNLFLLFAWVYNERGHIIRKGNKTNQSPFISAMHVLVERASRTLVGFGVFINNTIKRLTYLHEIISRYLI